MDGHTAYIMGELCSRAYASSSTLQTMFTNNPTIGSLAWSYDPANFIQDQTTGTECFIVSSNRIIAVVFRGTEFPSIGDILNIVGGIPFSSLNELNAGIQNCLNNPATPGQEKIKKYLNDVNWITDFLVDAANIRYDSSWIPGQPNVKVGFGWLSAWSGVKTAVEQKLTQLISKLNPGSAAPVTVYVTGHSLGGAIATLAAADLWHDVLVKNPGCFLRTYTFGSPYVGNADFAGYYNSVMTSAEAESWGIRNRQYEPIGTINTLVLGNSLLFNDPYVDVASESVIDGSQHWISSYISEFVNEPPSDSLEGEVVPTPFLDDPVTSLTIRTFTSANRFYAVGQVPIAWQIELVLVKDDQTSITIQLGTSDQVAPFYLPGQIDTFLEITVPPELTIADFRQCTLNLANPIFDGNANVDGSQPILLEGIQLYINGYDFYTNYSLGISLSAANTGFSFIVPMPSYLVTGGATYWTDITSKAPYQKAYSWGFNTGKEIVFNNNCLVFNSLLPTPAEGYQKTVLYMQSYFPNVPYLMPQQVVGGYTMVMDINSQSPQLLSTWGEKSTDDDVCQLFTSGYCYNYFLNAKGYFHAFLVLRSNDSLIETASRLFGGAMYVTGDHDSKNLTMARSWGHKPPLPTLGNFPPNLPLIVAGYAWNNHIKGPGYQYTALHFDNRVYSSGTIDIVVQFTIVSIYCYQTSDYSGDEIYLTKEGTRIWPDKQYESIAPYQTLDIGLSGFIVTSNQSVNFDLYDYDIFSKDDLIVTFPFTPGSLVEDGNGNSIRLYACQAGKNYQMRPSSQGESAIYILTISIEDIR